MDTSVMVALIGAGGAVAAAVITILPQVLKRRSDSARHEKPDKPPAPLDESRKKVPSTWPSTPAAKWKQLDIIDALLGAYPYNAAAGYGLTGELQVPLLSKAHEAKLPDGSNAFPAMDDWDGKPRTNRMNDHVETGKAIKRNCTFRQNRRSPGLPTSESCMKRWRR